MKMKQVNEEHINALLELTNSGSYLELLAMRVCELGIGYSKVEMDLQKKHYNPFGSIHGGAWWSLLFR